MASTSSRTLDIRVISAENLLIDRKSVKKNAYVVVKSDFSGISRTTEINEKSERRFVEWDENLVLDLPMNARFLTVEVHCRSSRSSGISRIVGTAKVPVSDFLGGYVPEGYLHFLSYRLRDSKGERNGIVNISVKVRVPSGQKCSSAAAPEERVAVKAGGRDFGGQVATGIPVWCPDAYSLRV